MNVGFTGTRKGMTDEQKVALSQELRLYEGSWEFHHGDCIGADAEAHDIVWDQMHDLGRYLTICVHPPEDNKLRAFKSVDGGLDVRTFNPKPYILRNHDIVDMTDVLIAAPASQERSSTRTGTWATVRYARKQGKEVLIIWPDGTRWGGFEHLPTE